MLIDYTRNATCVSAVIFPVSFLKSITKSIAKCSDRVKSHPNANSETTEVIANIIL